jgi:hypothetical protein
MRKNKTFGSLAAAERHKILLSGDEPWKGHRDFENEDPDTRLCCSGYECGCGGETIRDHFMAVRSKLPPLHGEVTIAVRTVCRSSWEAVVRP